MARTAQIARGPSDPPRRWIQREYADHEGNTVILGKISSESQFNQPESEEFEAYRLQIYSTAPIQPEEFNKLYEYFFSGFDQFPFLEIYSYSPEDGLACVEHQRHEVAYRKRLHVGQGEGEDNESLPPLIPTMRTGFKDHFMSGFCFLLTSKSYLKGAFRDNDHGTGPWWISFERSLPAAVKKLPMIKRLGGPATELETFKEWGISVDSEIRDINVDITTDQSGFGFDMKDLMVGRYSTYVYGKIDYGLHEPPPPSPSEETPTLQHVQEALEQQKMAEIQSIDSEVLRLTWGPENSTLTVTNNPSDGECDLQYVIYVQFLAHIEQERTAVLETTARTFTAGIMSHLPLPKSMYFEFRIPDSDSLSSLISSPPNGFDIGASHEFEAGSGTFIRALPQGSRDYSFRPYAHHYFTVVLDKPSFIQEPGVLFFTIWSDPLPEVDIDPDTTTDRVIETRRSAGIYEATRRLAMLSVEDNVQDSPRKLTQEEHAELLSLSPEEYEQQMNF
ncbi:hypothetical protein E8E15_007562 [Penicillium rubens]|uniref:Pc12g06540 protein n=2 Tax=Penicillium chrysogenum species complex TaxID=254878 RepID=B6H0E9_PENRW|nr:uncharacterized protein N7525_001898 [Penicillium rubens]KZN84902.1 hypothetical protein EN45_090640 [Penicillium chrysogenum]CAP80281.1 Pc12g06540 [Penicillium rubens Wisconsin 54-1255]KAF3028864.1 hypothetical protein E8E15_007562 [Penicillium rubens]KAJ5034162.1 hypothetical protein NUH16_005593 [Penicillium rubens]KAJ5844157.1 hypothetical protein N7525_001898 [Penicillium rubens]